MNMKKTIYCIFIFLLFVASSSLSHAQGKGALKQLIKNGEKSLPSSLGKDRFSKLAELSELSQVSRQTGLLHALEEAASVQRIRAPYYKSELERQWHLSLLDPNIFQATEEGYFFSNIFSGTIFSIVYNGEKEVYGAIATHSIAATPLGTDMLHKTFTATIYVDGEEISVPVEIVASMPRIMGDVSLVKFPEDVENILAPFPLGSLNQDQEVLSKGFSREDPISIKHRKVVSSTPASIRTTMPFPRVFRPGLCGSAVLNNKGEVLGIHTGSIFNKNGENYDIAYVTPSHYLKYLVEAYHNQGQAKIPFIINNQKLFDLNVEEYITHVVITDSEKNLLWQMQVESKFSYSKLQEALTLNPQAEFLQITTRRAAWTEDGNAFVENRTKTDRNLRTTYIYNLQDKQLERISQSVYDVNSNKRNMILLYSRGE